MEYLNFTLLNFGLTSHFKIYFIFNALKEGFSQSNWNFPLRILLLINIVYINYLHSNKYLSNSIIDEDTPTCKNLIKVFKVISLILNYSTLFVQVRDLHRHFHNRSQTSKFELIFQTNPVLSILRT